MRSSRSSVDGGEVLCVADWGATVERIRGVQWLERLLKLCRLTWLG